MARGKRLGALIAILLLLVVAIVMLRRHDEDRESAAKPGSATGSAQTHTGTRIVRTRPALPPADEPVLDLLPGEQRVEGQVIDTEARPVPGATVFLAFGQELYQRTTTTEADGSFVFDKLKDASIRLRAQKDDLYTEVVVMRPTAHSDPVTLHARLGAVLAIRVVDAQTQQPVVGARVTDRYREAKADDHGVARLGGLSFGFKVIDTFADGYAPKTVTLSLANDPGVKIERTITIERGAAVSGTVVGPDDKPISGAKIAYNTSTTTDVDELDVTSGADGTWRVSALARGTYVFLATAPGYGPIKPTPIEIDGSTPRSGIVLRVGLNGQIAGEVLDSTGKPAGGATVIVERAFAMGETTTTDAAGHFVLQGLALGEVTVYASRGGQASPELKVELAENRRVEVRLEMGAAAEVSGTVVDSRRQPVSDATVTLHSTANLFLQRSDARGKFKFIGVPLGKARLSAQRSEDDEHRVDEPEIEVDAPQTDIELEIGDVATVTGRVVLDRKPVAYYGIVFERNEIRGFTTPHVIRSSDGRFERRNIAPGAWRVVIAGPSFARKSLTVQIEEGKSTDLGDVVVDRGQRVTGRVLAGGQPVAGAAVTAAAETPSDSPDHEMLDMIAGVRTVRSEADGRYVLDGLSTISKFERLRLQARHPSYGVSPPRSVEPTDTNIDLRLAATGEIAGIVEGHLDQSVTATSIANKDYSEFTTPDHSGAFALRGLPAGEYRIELTSMGRHLPSAKPVRTTVKAGQTTTVKIIAAKDAARVEIHAIDGRCNAVTLHTDVEDELIFELCENQRAVFPDVRPGPVKVCIDMRACEQIVVQPSKPQTFEVHGRK